MNADSWQWQNGVLTCNLLSHWRHGFFTRSHAPQMPVDLQVHFHPDSQAYRIRQVHGDRIVNSQDIDLDSPLPEADGIWASNELGEVSSRSIWVCSADCVPMLMGDRVLGTVAAVHAGWRGTAGGIVARAIALFLDRGSRLQDLCVALGPAISGEVYQVSQDVADKVSTILASPVGVQPDPKPGHCRLDLRAIQQQQLLELGMNPAQVAIAPYCTLQTPEHFFSYRRSCLESPDNASRKSQVQWSGIAVSRA